MELEHGRVLNFALNYRACIRGEWMAVVRYDTAHGHLHVHENWNPPGKAIRNLEDSKHSGPPYNEELDQAEEDLKENWKEYRRRMERKVKHDV